MAPPTYDLVLLGATGYTGRLTAEHIATSLPTDLKWALAGRSASKLTHLAEELRSFNADRAEPGIEVLELVPAELEVLVKKTRLVINTVGPFVTWGTPVYEACARSGTHYLDCSGENPWLLEMIRKYHDVATKSGAIMISACGFDSVPADLVAWTCANYLRTTFGAPTTTLVNSLHAVSGSISGGTLASGMATLDTYSLRALIAANAPFALSPLPPSPASTQPIGGLSRKLLGILSIPELGILGDSPQAGCDEAVVQRSWGLLHGAYGPAFRFTEAIRMPNRLAAVAWHLTLLTVGACLLLPPMRWAVRRLWYAPGDGMDRAQRARSHFEYRGLGTAEGGGRAMAKVAYKGDPYVFTGIALAEAARVVLGEEEMEARRLGGGSLTPAMLGEPFVRRLRDAGVVVEVETVV